jgi:hypothetical protein
VDENLHHSGIEKKDVLRLVVLLDYKIALPHRQLRWGFGQQPERACRQTLQKWNPDQLFHLNHRAKQCSRNMIRRTRITRN